MLNLKRASAVTWKERFDTSLILLDMLDTASCLGIEQEVVGNW